MVITDYDKITEADETEFESGPWVCSLNSTVKTLCHRARTAHVAAHRAQGLAPDVFEAVVTPWMDEGTDWVRVSSIVHNTGVEPLVLCQNQVVGTVSVVTDIERGPHLLQPEATSEATPEDLPMHTISAIQAQIAEGKQFLLPEGDCRKHKNGRQVIGHIKQDVEPSAAFQVWHAKWYEKIKFGERLTQLQRSELAMVLFAFNGMIVANVKAPKLIRGVEHVIEFDLTQRVRPFKGHMRRLSPAERASQDEETKTLLANGLIRPSTSPWAAPTVIIPKKDGGPRYAIDYRVLNSYTIKDSHPLPRCDDVCDAANGA